MASNWDGWDEEDQQTASASSNNNTSSNHNSSGNRNNNSRVNDEPPHRNDDLGEAPELPPIFFTYDPITNKLEVRDRRGNVKAEFSVKTEQGASAYDLWVKGRVDGSDTSYAAYMKDMRGKDGRDGKNAFEEWQDSRDPNTDRSWEAYLKFFTGDKGQSAFELWKEVHGEIANSTPDDFFEYLKGQNGKDAFEVWQDLGYKNSTREDFFKWIASLVETQKGEDGKIFYPHFDGYTLYFTEDFEGKGIRLTEKEIRGKDGRTFEPKFEGTKLHFEDGEGTSTIPVELRGKDAFELWKEYHHKPDAKYGEFEEYFKGQNVQATHSYMDVTNWQCPVQEINTDLIVNSFNTARTPSAFIADRQKMIQHLRDEGNEVITKKTKSGKEKRKFKNWGGWFKEFTWWCAGADRSLLRMCPGDHSKYTGIGTVILFTALMAWFSSFIAIQLVFSPIHVEEGDLLFKLFGKPFDIPLWAFLFATFWGAMIFFLDRFITNTMYSDGEVTISPKEFQSGLPRILIAIFLGIVISAPLELKIFEGSIKQQMASDIEKEIAEFEKSTRQGVSDNENEELIELKESIRRDSLDYAEKQVEISNLKLDGYPKEENYTQATYSYDYSGTKDTNPNYGNRTGQGPRVHDPNGFRKAVNDWNKEHPSYADLNKKCLLLSDSLSIKRSLLNSRSRTINDTINSRVNRKVQEYESSIDTTLLRRIHTLHSLAMKGYAPLFNKDTLSLNTSELSSSEQKNTEHTKLSKKTPDWDLTLKCILSLIFTLLFIFLVLKKKINVQKERPEIKVWPKIAIGVTLSIIAGCLIGYNYEIFHSLLYYFSTPIGLIMLLFILIDISPVLYKMMLADGVYDKYLQEEKALTQEKIRLNNAQMLRTVEKGELKSVSPFIMGDVYEDLLDSASDSKNEGDIPARNRHINWSEGDAAYNLDKIIAEYNKEVFDTVIDFKKRIVLASYAAWYRDMRDAMIGKKDDDKGNLIKPEIILEETPDSNQGADN